MRITSFTALLGLAYAMTACTPSVDETDGDDDTETATDTGSETETDTGTETETETETDAPDLTEAVFIMPDDRRGLAFNISAIDFSEDLVINGVIVERTVDAATLTVELKDVPEGDLVEIDPSNLPGFKLAYYVTSLHLERDGNGKHDVGERYVGTGPSMLAFLANTPAQVKLLGYRDGWNALDMSTEPPTAIRLQRVPVERNLDAVMHLRMSGTFENDEPVDRWRGALLPSDAFDGERPDTLLQDGKLGDPFTFELSGAPPEDHTSKDPELNGLALEVPFAYVDTDKSGSISKGDNPIQPVCLEGEPVAALWIPPPVELDVAVQFVFANLVPGWGAVLVNELEGDGPPKYLGEDLRNELVVDDATCTFE